MRLGGGAVTPRTPAQELALAQRRLAGASRRYWAAHEVIEREKRRISILTARIETGPGHVLTRDPDVNQPPYMYPHYAFCRYCGAPAGSIAGKDTCAGDVHRCSVVVPECASPTAFRIYVGYWLCGQPGSYDEAFTAWTCAAGHITDTVCEERRHVSGPPCACAGLMRINPA